MANGDHLRVPRVCREPDTSTRQSREGAAMGCSLWGIEKLPLATIHCKFKRKKKKKTQIKAEILYPWKHLVSSGLERVIRFTCYISAVSDSAKITMIETISSNAFIWQINEHYREPHPELGARATTEKVEMEAAPLELTVWSRVV